MIPFGFAFGQGRFVWLCEGSQSGEKTTPSFRNPACPEPTYPPMAKKCLENSKQFYITTLSIYLVVFLSNLVLLLCSFQSCLKNLVLVGDCYVGDRKTIC